MLQLTDAAPEAVWVSASVFKICVRPWASFAVGFFFTLSQKNLYGRGCPSDSSTRAIVPLVNIIHAPKTQSTLGQTLVFRCSGAREQLDWWNEPHGFTFQKCFQVGSPTYIVFFGGRYQRNKTSASPRLVLRGLNGSLFQTVF